VKQDEPDNLPYTHEAVAVNDPTSSIEFRRELAGLLNRYNIDNWAEIPDHILADILADLIPPVRWGRIATAKWMGQPLLGEKLAASLTAGAPVAHEWAWPGEDTSSIADSPFPLGDPRGFNEYQRCVSDMCAVQRKHTGTCQAKWLEQSRRDEEDV
jgi:hypothetical protein